MKCRKKHFVPSFFLMLFLVIGTALHAENARAENIRVFSFNIQIFGRAKMAKPDVVNILTDIVALADIIAIQEVRTANIEPVEQFMRLLPARYACVIGPREGRSSAKEQFWIIYDTDKVRVLDTETWNDPEDVFERNPFAVFFQTLDKFDFIVIDNHIQPSNADREISVLPQVVDHYRRNWNETDILLVGDFNADGSYYDERFLRDVFPPEQYRIVISNEYDTSLGRAENTYDRIIITSSAVEDYADKCGVLRFDELYNFDQYTIRPRDVSDHYPIWAEFRIDADTD
ncbi:MAG: endonuclease [Spirochaetaceae bacterium]|jgi:endonuclease/exonuclease/phosphatase family metal-dependent hydrolase|nr:endonuclease [Spirochaetaceae bacterium]